MTTPLSNGLTSTGRSLRDRPRRTAEALAQTADSVSPKQAQSLSLAINELATNALKYGALSVRDGRVTINWSLDDGEFSLEWREEGGPPVTPPTRRGFGTILIEQVLAHDFDGTVCIDYSEQGVVCRLIAPDIRKAQAYGPTADRK